MVRKNAAVTLRLPDSLKRSLAEQSLRIARRPPKLPPDPERNASECPLDVSKPFDLAHFFQYPAVRTKSYRGCRGFLYQMAQILAPGAEIFEL
jgi:hypothetical protein